MKKPTTKNRETEFFQKLLALAREYNVNLQANEVTFHNEKKHNEVSFYSWVDVTGGWKINEENVALVAVKVIKPATDATITIKGN